jgi:hypothetical protein
MIELAQLCGLSAELAFGIQLQGRCHPSSAQPLSILIHFPMGKPGTNVKLDSEVQAIFRVYAAYKRRD